MTVSDCEVLVVGAGPTGLMAANVRIVDDRAEASRESRAFAMQARSVKSLQRLGLVDEVLAQGVINTSIGFFAYSDAK